MNQQTFLAAANVQSTMLPALIALFVIAAVLIIACIAFTVLCLKTKARRGTRRKPNNTRTILLIAGYLAAVIALLAALICLGSYQKAGQQLQGSTESSTGEQNTQQQTGEVTDPPTDAATEPPTEPQPTLTPGQAESANPSNFGVKWDVINNNSVTGNYNRSNPISFADPTRTNYFALPGIATFRGNNYRDGAAYGTVNIVNKTLTNIWEKEISSMPKGVSSGYWTGCGWTGQPLMVQWDEQTKQIMNLYPEKKAKKDLVEVIYATLDGNIYFYDLQDGSYTRDPMKVGMTFKGAGALDPRGYPLFYVGSGDTYDGKKPRMYVISLIDCSILYERGYSESVNYRGWYAFDSSPLVHSDSDTLIWPGESGLLYTIKLNTTYNKSAGTLSIQPDEPVMTRYTTSADRTKGYESSCVIVENYLYIGDNGGMLFCVDLNTMKLQWAQNVHDDVNATPVFSWENGKGYLYTGSSMEYSNGTVYITKLDASTGAIVWENKYTDVYYDKGVSGGIMGSPVLGKKGTDLEGMIVYTIARAPGAYNGIALALDQQTGEVVWEKEMNSYAWSSPVALYNADGTAFIILCDSSGNVHMMDGKTGETLAKTSVGSNVEASPAVFNNTLVVGTRGQKVFGIQIG